MYSRTKMTFKMKIAVVISLIFNFWLVLSLPIENVPERTKKSPQESVPLALLLLVPPTPQFRDEEGILKELQSESGPFPFTEDLVKTLLRDVDGFLDDKQVNHLLERKEKNEEDTDEGVKIFSHDITVNFLPHLISEDDTQINKDIQLSFVSEVPLQSIEDIASKTSPLKNEAGLLPEVEEKIAKYPNLPNSAIPLLLNCAPKVERGHLSESPESYNQDNIGLDIQKSDTIDLKSDLDFKPSEVPDKNSKSLDLKASDVLDLSSPTSVLTTERRKRHLLQETGATHYKVSEDFPESFKGDRHLVSEDYPEPNMVRIIETSKL